MPSPLSDSLALLSPLSTSHDTELSLELSRDTESSLELVSSDFGGSQCEERNPPGEQIPDEPFGDPRLPIDQRSSAMDIIRFRLNSLYYPDWVLALPIEPASAGLGKIRLSGESEGADNEGKFPRCVSPGGRIYYTEVLGSRVRDS